LETKTKVDDALLPAVKLLRSGHILDPDPRKRTTAAALADELEQFSRRARDLEDDLGENNDLFGAHYEHENAKFDPPAKEDLLFDCWEEGKSSHDAFVKPDQPLSSAKVVGSETSGDGYPDSSISAAANSNQSSTVDTSADAQDCFSNCAGIVDGSANPRPGVSCPDQPLQDSNLGTNNSHDVEPEWKVREFFATNCPRMLVTDDTIDQLTTRTSDTEKLNTRSLFGSAIMRFAHSLHTASDVQEPSEESPTRTLEVTLLSLEISHIETTSQSPLLSFRTGTTADASRRVRSWSPHRAGLPTSRLRKRNRFKSQERSEDSKAMKSSPREGKTGGRGAPSWMRSGGVTRFRSGDYGAKNQFLDGC
jgi:hypothetical protein